MLMSFNNIWFAYESSKHVLKGISFDIKHGEKIALLGLNGSGKSTLILHTNGLLLPQKGEVLVNGVSTKSKGLYGIRQKVGIVFQNPEDQLFMPTVKEDVAFGPRNMELSEKEIEERVNYALTVTKTLELANRSQFELSGGQKKSVSIATVLSMTPELLVMDEPTSGLDYLAVRNFIELVKSLPQALLISTHDIDLAKRVTSRAIVLKEGEIISDTQINQLEYP